MATSISAVPTGTTHEGLGTQAPTKANPVSTLAQGTSAVGGPHDNHGGAVSTLARSRGGKDAPEATDAPEANRHA